MDAPPTGNMVQATLRQINKSYYDTIRDYQKKLTEVREQLKRRKYRNPKQYAALKQREQSLQSQIAILEFG